MRLTDLNRAPTLALVRAAESHLQAMAMRAIVGRNVAPGRTSEAEVGAFPLLNNLAVKLCRLRMHKDSFMTESSLRMSYSHLMIVPPRSLAATIPIGDAAGVTVVGVAVGQGLIPGLPNRQPDLAAIQVELWVPTMALQAKGGATIAVTKTPRPVALQCPIL